MFKNYLATWKLLAPDEASQLTSIDFGVFQDCIEAKHWGWSVTYNAKTGIYEASVDKYNEMPPIIQAGSFSGEALFMAYLTALAEIREIKPNSRWRHFKGEEYVAFGVAVPTSNKFLGLPRVVIGSFALEELPGRDIIVSQFGTQFEHNEPPITGDRVIYHGDCVRWAALTTSFLGLVGPEHPEHEGKLRFTAVADE